jgi:NTP pyrophosphatase (non-canonical NTP hydrolase)
VTAKKEQPKDLSEFAQLSKQCVEDSERWFGDQGTHRSLAHHSLALAGEVGEFCNVIKKIDRGSLNIHDAEVRYRLAMEATDIYVYLLTIAGLLNVDLSKAYLHVRANNEKRFMEERAKREAAHNG